MSKRFFFVLFILLCLACNDQVKDNSQAKSNLIELQQKSIKNQDSTYYFLKKGVELIKLFPELSDSLRAENNYALGSYFYAKGVMDSAAHYSHKATDFSADSLQYDREIDYFYQSWYVYYSQGKYGDCISIVDKLESLLDDKDYNNQVFVNYLYENTYKANEDFKQAILYNKKQINTYSNIPNTVPSIREAVIFQSEYEYQLKNKKRAYKLLDSLLNIESRLNETTKYNLYNRYGIQTFDEKKFKSSLDFFIKSLSHLKKVPKNRTSADQKARLYYNISEAYFALKKYNKAYTYLDSAFYLNSKNGNETVLRSILQKQLELAVVTDKDPTKLSNSLDSIFNYQKDQYTKKYKEDLVALEKALKKENEILAEKKDIEIKSITRLFTLIIIVSILIILSIFFYRQRMYKVKKQSLQMQQRLLRSQMNPHFTFNTLYTIQNLIKDTPLKAKNYLIKFSRLLRLILENSTQNYVLFKDELKALKEYYALQQVRFPDKFEFYIQLNNLEEDSFIFIPPMLIQPMIENSIEHGFNGINYKGKLVLTLTQKKSFLECKIEDNGRGLQSESSDIKKSTSLELIHDYLKKSTGKGIQITDKDSLDINETGVIVSFKIPFKLTKND
ncbi:histidine kinase [Tenacibaculum sp. 190524A05c]|uniref:tetratricopeptide repeat-containing sensor histidine kinase n=1 Tax=Tenacibaculum platacis TaxID=3137852 RepID=UPI0031FA641A